MPMLTAGCRMIEQLVCSPDKASAAAAAPANRLLVAALQARLPPPPSAAQPLLRHVLSWLTPRCVGLARAPPHSRPPAQGFCFGKPSSMRLRQSAPQGRVPAAPLQPFRRSSAAARFAWCGRVLQARTFRRIAHRAPTLAAATPAQAFPLNEPLQQAACTAFVAMVHSLSVDCRLAAAACVNMSVLELATAAARNHNTNPRLVVRRSTLPGRAQPA